MKKTNQKIDLTTFKVKIEKFKWVLRFLSEYEPLPIMACTFCSVWNVSYRPPHSNGMVEPSSSPKENCETDPKQPYTAEIELALVPLPSGIEILVNRSFSTEIATGKTTERRDAKGIVKTVSVTQLPQCVHVTAELEPITEEDPRVREAYQIIDEKGLFIGRRADSIEPSQIKIEPDYKIKLKDFFHQQK